MLVECTQIQVLRDEHNLEGFVIYFEDAGTRTWDLSTKHAYASALTICATSLLTRARTRTLYRDPDVAGIPCLQ